MQQFTVPQFIDVEDKIIGPVTTRQFVIMMVCFILIAVSYKIFDFSLFAFSGLLLLGIFGILAFGRVNGRPFHFFILNLIQTFKRPRLRIWNNYLGKSSYDYPIYEAREAVRVQEIARKNYSASRLSELAIVVDTGGSYREDKLIRAMENLKVDDRKINNIR